MRISARKWRLAALALLLAAVGCAPGEREAEHADEAAPTAEADAASEEAPAEPEAEVSEVAAPDVAAERPGAVAPADEAEARVVRNWVVLEFSRRVEEADLEWLEANGFRVDSVMGELRVRGWLEDAEGGGAIAGDPRIARVHTQMR